MNSSRSNPGLEFANAFGVQNEAVLKLLSHVVAALHRVLGACKKVRTSVSTALKALC